MNKRYILLVVVIVAFCANDFISRVLITSDDFTIPGMKEVSAYPSLEPVSALHQKMILMGYDQYDVQRVDEESENNDIPGMSLTEQAKQQGDLEQLYARNFVFSLKAIITDTSRGYRKYALLEQYNITTKKLELLRLEQAENLFEYNVSSLNTDSIELITKKDEAERKILLHLYRKKKR